MYLAAIAKAEVARVGCQEFVFEGSRAMPDDAGSLAGGGYVLPDFAFLAERTIGALLVMAVDRSRIGHIHQLVRAFVGKGEGLGDLKLAGLVPSLGCCLAGQRG